MNIFSCPFESNNVMNIFSCPFEGKKESKLPYTKEDLFALHQISFVIEQAITTFLKITKDNEIIYEIDFVNDRVHEIHTNYNGKPESWGWQENVKEILSKVKPISNIVIRDEQDIYSILTNREKLECLLQEYEKKKNHRLANEGEQQVCCDENTPCVYIENNDSNNKNAISLTDTTELLVATEKNQQQLQQQVRQQVKDELHKGENRHSKNADEQFNELEKELNNEHLKPDPKLKIKEKLEKSKREQQILLKENKQNIIELIIDNKESIRVEDLKIYEPIYKCYREKGNCIICNSLSNIICTDRCNNHKEIWFCIKHWQQHKIEKYE